MDTPAEKHLREIRERCGLTLKQVENLSHKLAQKKRNKRYILSSARLCQIEGNGSLPSIYKIASLSNAYRVPILALLNLYGIGTKASLDSATGSSS